MLIPLEHKAQLYEQLALGYKTGLQPAVLLTRGMLPGGFDRFLPQLQRMLDKGKPLSAMLAAVKWCEPWESRLLAAGETLGSLEQTLEDLGHNFRARHLQVAELQARLQYPLLTLAAGIVLGPVPALAQGALSGAAYILSVGAKLLVAGGIYRYGIVQPLQRAGGGAFNPLVAKAAKRAGSHHWLRQLYEVAYLNLLTAAHAAGLDVVGTLRLLRDNCSDAFVRQQHTTAIADVEQHGTALTEVLVANGLLRNPEIIGFVLTAEKSGTLHSDLRLYLKRRDNELAAVLRYKLKQLSNGLYGATLLLVVAGIL